MALATQCPYCHTTFRVAHDQLKLRAGLVRCGACKQIFNGIEHLLRQEDATPEGGVPIRPESEAEPAALPPGHNNPIDTASALTSEPYPVEDDKQFEPSTRLDAEEVRHTVIPTPLTEQPLQASDDTSDDPLQRMTLMDLADEGDHPSTTISAPSTGTDAGTDAPDPLAKAIEELQSKPMRSAKKPSPKNKSREDNKGEEEAYEEPSFVKQGNRRRRLGRALHITAQIGSIVLLLTLIAQSAYLFRNQIAAWFPGTKPLLTQGCAILKCQVGLPAQIDMVSIESSELQSLAQDKNIFALNALLRNHGTTPQAWPSIELTLNDVNETPVARKVFMPRDYLPSGLDAAKGFEPKSERPIKVFFEISQLNAAGYRVYLFYP